MKTEYENEASVDVIDDFVWVIHSPTKFFYDASPTESEIFANATNQTSNNNEETGYQEETPIRQKPELHKDLDGLKRVELIHGGKTLLQIKFLDQNGRIIFECRKKKYLQVKYVDTIFRKKTIPA